MSLIRKKRFVLSLEQENADPAEKQAIYELAKTLFGQKEVDVTMLRQFKDLVLPPSAISSYAELIKMGLLEWLG